ncbi:hypothetical protein NP233_g1977 [Leucocoprinus birnbaumii]|uniref:Uncharacterized protein n=1 Tax=Leucocoprinus birnbaumii TaxID=56174 RepID=A0AAD5YU93_9AGAR|nr:hypothetical protein NP233_g1977 [Leucocoprinus birnbaumii]
MEFETGKWRETEVNRTGEKQASKARTSSLRAEKSARPCDSVNSVIGSRLLPASTGRVFSLVSSPLGSSTLLHLSRRLSRPSQAGPSSFYSGCLPLLVQPSRLAGRTYFQARCA